jgi:RimJ/RimL family protein N-acetyltransferase
MGLATALVEPGLAHADRERLPAYVEAGSEEAAAFYEGLGFALIGEARVSSAPVVYLMWREPQ